MHREQLGRSPEQRIFLVPERSNYRVVSIGFAEKAGGIRTASLARSTFGGPVTFLRLGNRGTHLGRRGAV